jgi:RHS repeat-associated protein
MLHMGSRQRGKAVGHIRNLLLLVAIGALSSLGVQAQQCYTPILSWQGNYTLTGTANAVPCTGDPQASCTMNHVSSADVSTSFSGSSCTIAGWGSFDANISVSFNDKQVAPCPPPGGESIGTAVGTTPVLSSSSLTVNLSNSTYSFEGSALGGGTATSIDCGGNQTTNSIPEYPLYPASNWPQTFPLPSSPGTLSVNSWGFQALGTPDETAAWTLSFTLTPDYKPDKPCEQKSNKKSVSDFPASSSVGCQNQSLGEDMPIVGTGFTLHYEGDRAPGAGANGTASGDASMIGGWTLNIHHAFDLGTHTLFLGDGSQRNGYQLGTPVILNANLLITSEDGSEVYVFSGSNGQHLQTLRPFTGALVYQFGYDAAGKLTTVTDASNNVTTIQRDNSEHPAAIISPFGQTTTLKVDANGFLTQITDPAGDTEQYTNSPAGLISSRTDANGNSSTYKYDGQGRLANDADSIGGFVSLSRTNANSGLGFTVAETTSMGRTFGYQTTLNLPWVQNGSSTESIQLTNTWPDGLQASQTRTAQNGQITNNTTLPDDTSDSRTLGPDPRFGLQRPVLTNEALTLGNLTMNITGSRTATFTQGNPFSLTSQTDTQTINGRKSTSIFTASTKTRVDTSPVKRKTTTILDSLERVSSVQVGALTPVQFTYDTNGRPLKITQGTRVTSFTYDTNGFLATSSDPLSQTTSFTYDSAGRLHTQTLPDGRMITYGYDANGNLASLTPPGQPAHDFSYTAVDRMSTYTPPSVPGTGATSYTYNLDRDLTKITRPDGQTFQFGYDSAGRLASTTTPTETFTYGFDPNTGTLNSAEITGGEALAYGYNGPLPTSSTLTGTVAGTVTRTYNNNFWIASESINGANTIDFTFDNDGLVTGAGSLILKLDPKDGLITGTTLGSATDSRKYDSFGELTGYSAKYGLKVLYSNTLTRDADGRISGKTETIGGKKNAYIYSYDLAGRLTSVKKNGVTISTYTYDSNSNRLTATTPLGGFAGTYDAQDRLLTYGNSSFTYTANGELAVQTMGGQTTTYTYDVLGNLTAVNLPNGAVITYVLDPENRRAGKQVNGALVAGYLYDGDRIVAQLNGSNVIVSQFAYGSGSTSPDYIIQGGVTYRIFSDQLGSPRLVVNAASGAVVEEIDYDEFGNVINDTNPGFQPFGFAGGLYDQDTKLVRFGARDYDPVVGRWTAKDPIRFAGGDTNIYGYVLNDPVNTTDAHGTGGEITNLIRDFLEKNGWTVEEFAKGLKDIECAKTGGKILNWARRSGTALYKTPGALLKNLEWIFQDPKYSERGIPYFSDYGFCQGTSYCGT